MAVCVRASIDAGRGTYIRADTSTPRYTPSGHSAGRERPVAAVQLYFLAGSCEKELGGGRVVSKNLAAARVFFAPAQARQTTVS